MEKQEDLMDSEQYRLWVLLTQIRKIFVKSRDKLIYPQVIPQAQGAALYYIHTRPEGVTVKEISSVLFLNHSSVSEVLLKMENKGWIKRTKDKKDARQSKITLTKEGQDACHLGGQPEHVCEIISILTTEQQEQLKSILEILTEEALKNFDWS